VKTGLHFSRIGIAAIAVFAAAPAHAQTFSPAYSDTIGYGAMGGVILLLLAQVNRLRGQLRRGARVTREVSAIHARQPEETALEREHEYLRALLDHASDRIYFKDKSSRFLLCNRAKSDRSEVTSRQIIGKSDFDFFDLRRAQSAFDDEQEIIRTGKPIIGRIDLEVTKNGQEFWALTSKWPLRDKNSEIIGTFGISRDITELKQAENRLAQAHKQLVDSSRMAGMAEVASTVLHNVGNVLNSVNVSSSVVSDKIKNSKVANLGKAVQLMREHHYDLAEFLKNDPKGRQLVSYLGNLADHLENEERDILKELASLCANVEHIKEIVTMQQAYARVSGVQETLQPSELVEDALRLNAGAVERHHVQVTREFLPTPPLVVDKHKVLQILVNLIRNAKYALDDCGHADKQMTLRVESNERTVKISVIDNGIGIPAENLTRIFGHGFTTRKDGHGFGLHSGALAARQLGGSLTCHSDGLNHGATFTLELPLAAGAANQ
jgi:PAS domain S-box-containing protein